MLYRGEILELNPNRRQTTYFRKACGVARLTYNWGLEEWTRQYQAGGKPNHRALDKQFNALKRERFPFVTEVTKCAAQIALQQLGAAFANFFRGTAKAPKFRKRGVQDRFSLANDVVKLRSDAVYISKLGWVRLKHAPRFAGRLLNAKVFTRGEHWFISLGWELPDFKPLAQTKKSVGVDLGIKHFATLSNGEKIANPRHLRRNLKRLKRLSRAYSRKQAKSNNQRKARATLSRLHYRIACLRKDFLHKTTTALLKRFGVVAIEDLNVAGLLKNHKLAQAISDVGFYEFKRQLLYKAEQFGRVIKQVERFFASSKICSVCGHKQAEMPLKIRHWQCVCGAIHDRDINAARNILHHAI